MFNKNLTLRLIIAIINRSDLILKAIVIKKYIFYFESSNIEKNFDKDFYDNVLRALNVTTIKLDSNKNDKSKILKIR